MKVTFLGTGTSQGVPVIACECDVCKSLDFRDKRLRVSVLVEVDSKFFLIDAGPDFRQQMLREGVKKLDAILITHEHKDHTAGLDDIRAFNFKHEKPMPIYASSEVHEQLKREYSYVFAETNYPGIPQMDLKPINNVPFSISHTQVIPIQVLHHKLQVFGFRIGEFTYITDANYISEIEIDKIKGSKVLVLNALQKSAHISHFTLEQAIDMARKIGAENTFFTHISHKMGLHAEVQKDLPKGISLAWDGLIVEL